MPKCKDSDDVETSVLGTQRARLMSHMSKEVGSHVSKVPGGREFECTCT